jgi:hypothetical protein
MSDGSEVVDNLLAKAQRSFEAAEGLLESSHEDFGARAPTQELVGTGHSAFS